MDIDPYAQQLGKLQGSVESLIVDINNVRTEIRDAFRGYGARIDVMEHRINENSEDIVSLKVRLNGNGNIWRHPWVKYGGPGVGGGALLLWLIDMTREWLSH